MYICQIIPPYMVLISRQLNLWVYKWLCESHNITWQQPLWENGKSIHEMVFHSSILILCNMFLLRPQGLWLWNEGKVRKSPWHTPCHYSFIATSEQGRILYCDYTDIDLHINVCEICWSWDCQRVKITPLIIITQELNENFPESNCLVRQYIA